MEDDFIYTVPVTLMKSISEKISIELIAKIDEEGNLVLEGYDNGPLVKEFWGDLDYEYWVTVPSDQKLVVLEQLIFDAFPTLLELHSWLRTTRIRFRCEEGDVEKKKFTVGNDESQIFICIAPKKPIIIFEKKVVNRLLLALLKYLYKTEFFNNDFGFEGWLKKRDLKFEFFSYV
jgi:hypothetical protein